MTDLMDVLPLPRKVSVQQHEPCNIFRTRIKRTAEAYQTCPSRAPVRRDQTDQDSVSQDVPILIFHTRPTFFFLLSCGMVYGDD